MTSERESRTTDPLVLSPVNVSADLDAAEQERIGRRLEAHGARLCLADPDPDHNRTVLTILGPPQPLVAALLDLFAWAVDLVDLETHEGVHPRVGAVDVVPFVPVRGVTMAACVELSRRLGREVAERWDIPVYLYGRSGPVPVRTGVAAIRRGGTRGLADRMLSEIDWKPDFGPARLHPRAGASIIGARDPLIAFNVELADANLAAAREVARAVRESSGGMGGLMAIGVLLASRGLAQVAMNVTRVEEAVLVRVFDLVREALEARGAEAAASELIGVAPREAFPTEGPDRILLRNWRPERVLEVNVKAWDAVGSAP